MATELKQTLFQICIIITLSLFIFNLSVHYVSGMGIFDTGSHSGIVPGDDGNTTFSSVTQDNTGMNGIWALVLTGAGLGGLVVAWMTHSTAILGVSIFSVAFWAAYLNTITILGIGNYIPEGFLLIGTAGMGFVWAGAIAGMLSGSG